MTCKSFNCFNYFNFLTYDQGEIDLLSRNYKCYNCSKIIKIVFKQQSEFKQLRALGHETLYCKECSKELFHVHIKTKLSYVTSSQIKKAQIEKRKSMVQSSTLDKYYGWSLCRKKNKTTMGI